jgi:cell division protein FtsZ
MDSSSPSSGLFGSAAPFMPPAAAPAELPLSADALSDRRITIKVVGVGGAGANAVDRLKLDDLDRVQLAVLNTDAQALAASPVAEKLLLGASVTRGLGAGADPELGRDAAEADRAKIEALVKGYDLVVIVAGMGGGTGSGAAPTVAEIAAEQGALVVAFVTLPFSFEGGRRVKQAEEGLVALRKVCDAVVPLPNDVLLQESADGETALDSFARADDWIGRGVKAVWAMLFRTGLINLDFATLRQVFHTRGGKTLFGLGHGEGAHAVTQAIASLKDCPLVSLPEFARRADRLLVNIVGGTDLSLAKVNELMSAITDQFGREAHVIMGAVIDEQLQGRIEVMVLGMSDVGGRPVSVRRFTRARPAFVEAAAASSPAAEAAGLTAAQGSSPERAPLPAVPSSLTKHPAPAATDLFGAAFAAATGRKRGAAKASAPVPQEEFGFNTYDARGQFEHTDRNLFEGQDLDRPTWLRKGLKLFLN